MNLKTVSNPATFPISVAIFEKKQKTKTRESDKVQRNRLVDVVPSNLRSTETKSYVTSQDRHPGLSKGENVERLVAGKNH